MPSSVYPNKLAAAITSPIMNAAPHDSRSKVSPMQVSQTAMSKAEGAFRLGLNSGALLTRHQKMRSVVLAQHRPNRPSPRRLVTYSRRQLLAKADIAASRVSA
jgi:hypothetical protein